MVGRLCRILTHGQPRPLTQVPRGVCDPRRVVRSYYHCLNGSLPTSNQGWAFVRHSHSHNAKPPKNWSANHDVDCNESIIPQGTDVLGTTPKPTFGKVD